MTPDEIEERVAGLARVDSRGTNPTLSRVAHDSREAEEGALFAALVGREADGHAYVDEAIASGADAILVDRDRVRDVDVEVPVLAADDSRRVLGPVADAVYGEPSSDLVVVGITGTDGKTTTAHLVRRIVERAGRRCGVLGTLGRQWPGHRSTGPNTTPESATIHRLLARMRADDVDVAVLEASSHGLATHRLTGVRFDCGVFTNLSRDHLDFHGDMASYRRAKRRLFTDLLPASDAPERTAVLNAGTDEGRDWAARLAGTELTVRTFGVDRDATTDVRARLERSELSGTAVTLVESAGEVRVELPLVGAFNVENAAAAWAAGRSLGIGPATIAEALETTDAPPGRLERIGAGGPGAPDVFVDYAHTPEALSRVLETLGSLTEGRLVAVFGCGGDRDRSKRPEMGRVVRDLADGAVVTSDNPRSESPEAIIGEIVAGIDETGGDFELSVDPDRGAAIERAIGGVGAGDVVVIAGKGHETRQVFADRTVAFDDRARARAALE